MCPSAGWAGSAPSWSGPRASAGAELRTAAEVVAIGPDGDVEIGGDRAERLRGRLVLSGVGPTVLERLLNNGVSGSSESPEGAQVKVNMLLRRLPRLRDERVAPEAAFAGTFHINETMTQLDDAYAVAAGGGIPNPLPAEIYCHSLTDPSILGARAAGRRRPDAHPLRTAGAASARGGAGSGCRTRGAARGRDPLARFGARRADRGLRLRGAGRHTVRGGAHDRRPGGVARA